MEKRDFLSKCPLYSEPVNGLSPRLETQKQNIPQSKKAVRREEDSFCELRLLPCEQQSNATVIRSDFMKILIHDSLKSSSSRREAFIQERLTEALERFYPSKHRVDVSLSQEGHNGPAQPH